MYESGFLFMMKEISKNKTQLEIDKEEFSQELHLLHTPRSGYKLQVVSKSGSF